MIIGSMGLWVFRSLGLWVSGSLGLWVFESLCLWVSGSLGRQSIAYCSSTLDGKSNLNMYHDHRLSTGTIFFHQYFNRNNHVPRPNVYFTFQSRQMQFPLRKCSQQLQLITFGKKSVQKKIVFQLLNCIVHNECECEWE